MSQYGNYKEALKELRVFGGKNDSKFWSDKPIQKNNPNNKRMKKIKQIWNNLFNKDDKLKDNLFLVNLDNAKLKSVNQNIKKDIQKIIDKDGFLSDVQEYINEL